MTTISTSVGTNSTTSPGAYADGERLRWTPQLYYSVGRFGLMSEDDPDYARCFTVTGRPRRDVIRAHVLGGAPGAAAGDTRIKEKA